jgi:maltose O-acetyltransferase
MNHDYLGTALPYDDQRILKPVDIGRNVWIGMNVCIAPGSKIGDGAIVGMGAVVSGEVPPLAIIGSPAFRILGTRDATHYEELEASGRYSGASGVPLE